MRALAYLLVRSFKNTVKGLIRKPAALIAYVIIACLILIPSIINKSTQQPITSRINVDIVKSVIMGYIMFLIGISVMSSLNGASLFRMADVNLLFTAPLKAGYVLIYGSIKQLAANVTIMLFLALQYPNWKRTFGLVDGSGWLLMAAYMLLITVTTFLGMILYAYVSKEPGRLFKVKRIIYALLVAFIVPIVVNTFITGNVLNSIVSWLSNDYLKFIPIIGWLREILMGAFLGISKEIFLYFFFILITSVAAFIYIYKMDTEFYENVIAGTEMKERILEATKKGQTAHTYVHRKYRKVKARFNLEGSLAILQRQILDKRKKGFWLLPIRTIILAIAAIIAALAIPADSMELMLGIFAVSAYIMFILRMAAAWESDLSYHYVYLIPAKPFNKMLAATIVDVINMLIESILIFGMLGVLLKISPSIVLSIIFAYAALGTVFIYSDLVVRRMFGKIHGNVLRIFFRIFLFFIIVIINVAPMVPTYLITENYALAFFISALVNSIVILLFMWIGTSLFRSPELA